MHEQKQTQELKTINYALKRDTYGPSVSMAVNWNYKDSLRNKNCRPIKGDEMLERYEGKLSLTVLRDREGAISPSYSTWYGKNHQ